MSAIELSVDPRPADAPAGSLAPPELDREFAAVVLGWTVAGVHDDRQAILALRRRIEALSAASVHVALVSEVDLQVLDDRLRARPNGPGQLLVATVSAGTMHTIDARGPALLQRQAANRDAAVAAVLGRFAADGIGRGLVLEIHDGPAGDAGSMPIRTVLDAVLARRRSGRVPSVDEDPDWVVRLRSGDTSSRRAAESLFSVVSGGVGTRGSVEELARGSVALTVAAGAYVDTGADQHLLPGPGWTRLQLSPPPGPDERVLDLRTGVLLRTECDAAEVPLRTARFASQAIPGLMVMRAESAPQRMTPGPALVGRATVPELRGRRRQWRSSVTGVEAAHIHALATQRERRGRRVHVLDRIAVYTAGAQTEPGPLPERLLDAADRLGFDRLLAEHRAAWAHRWNAVDVRIPDDRAAQLAARFALFQLWSHSGRADDLALGARGLTGAGQGGHVSWEADAFVAPALATIDPAAARAMVLYRHGRLAAARARAAAGGWPGARFPSESGADGHELGPARIARTAEHVTADVAWAAGFCAEWQGRTIARGSSEADLLVDTARYWVGRCRRAADGRAHIDHVTGPDEFHEGVSDNAFTNGLARWNLRAAAQVWGDPEARDWRDLADALVDGYDPRTGRYEQFAGFFDRQSAIQQPDVLLLHHLVPEATAAGSLDADLAYYLPRTAPGAPLTPAVTATLLARAGRPDAALDALRAGAALDLYAGTTTKPDGLSLAALAGIWHALLFGFAGARVRGGCLYLDPHLPTAWPRFEIRFMALGRAVRLHLDGRRADIWSDGSLRVRLAGDWQQSRRLGIS